MRTAATRVLPSRYSIVVVTTDNLVPPEAETYLSGDYDLRLLQTWDELVAVVGKQLPDAVLLDIDTVGERSEEGIAALRELRAVGPDLVPLP